LFVAATTRTSTLTVDPVALLQHPQELCLHLRRHVADLVQEQGPAVRPLELTPPQLRGSRERTRLVPEEFAFDQAFGNRGAVEFLERSDGSGGAGMNRSGDQLLACTPLSEDQNLRIRACRQLDLLAKPFHARALP
jgi:hypothetical protein